MRRLLLRAEGHLGGLVLAHTAADGTRLLDAKIERGVLLARVVRAQVLPLRLVEHSQDRGDRLADNLAVNANGAFSFQ